jgi:hypothetical protein
VHIKEEQPAAEGLGVGAAGGTLTTTAPDQAAAGISAAEDTSKASADTQMPLADGSSAGAVQPELAPPAAAQQGGRQRAEPDWFVGGRNGEDGFASCAPGRSFAASKASLMGSSGSQGSRSAWLPRTRTSLLSRSVASACLAARAGRLAASQIQSSHVKCLFGGKSGC